MGFKEPNHLNPAIFDCDSILVAGFWDLEQVHSWWASDEVVLLLAVLLESRGFRAHEAPRDHGEDEPPHRRWWGKRSF